MACSRSLTNKQKSLIEMRPSGSPMSWHGSAHSGANASGPTAGHCLHVGVEADTFHSMHVMVAKKRALPTAKAVEGHRYGDRNVDANHAHLHLVGKGARGVSIAGKDASAVAVFVIVHQIQSLLKARNAQHGEDGTKNLFAVDAHL